MQRTDVKSSNVKSIGYDPKNQILEVEFHNKSIYQYANVQKELYKSLMASESIGGFLHKNIIKKGFKAARTDDEYTGG